jgi:hypothetical protein
MRQQGGSEPFAVAVGEVIVRGCAEFKFADARRPDVDVLGGRVIAQIRRSAGTCPASTAHGPAHRFSMATMFLLLRPVRGCRLRATLEPVSTPSADPYADRARAA